MDTTLILTKRPTPYWLDLVHALHQNCYIISDLPYDDLNVLNLDKDVCRAAGFHSVSIHHPNNFGVYAWEKSLYYSCFHCDSEYIWFVEDDTYFRDAQSLVELSTMYRDNNADLLFNPWPLRTDDPLMEFTYENGSIWTPDKRFFGGETFTRAFVPVCRMSKKLRDLIARLAAEHNGLPHLETLIPTVCTRNGLKTDLIDQSVFDISFNTMPKRSIDGRFLTNPRLKAYHRCKDVASTVYQEYPSRPLTEQEKVIFDVIILAKKPTPYWDAMIEDVTQKIKGVCGIALDQEDEQVGSSFSSISDEMCLERGFQKLTVKGTPQAKEKFSREKELQVEEEKDVTATDKAFYWMSKLAANDALDYVWLIEDDVYFRNPDSLVSLVKDYENDPADFIAASCFERPEYSEWLTQKWFIDEKFFGEKSFWQSPTSICRVSKRLISAVAEMAAKHGSLPYIEALLPTMTIKNGWTYRTLANSVHPYCEEGREVMGCPHPKADTKYLLSIVEWTQKEVNSFFFQHRNLMAFRKVKNITPVKRRTVTRRL